MLRGWQTEWPCLSFSVLRDGIGEERTGFPMSSLLVAGTQAADPGANQLILMRLANLQKNGREVKDEQMDSEDEDESDSEDDDDDEGRKPHFTAVTLAHPGGVNRIRNHASHPSVLTATWSDLGQVHLWSLADAQKVVEGASTTSGAHKTFPLQQQSLYVFNHGVEGYALDWSRPVSPSISLLAGDCKGRISLTRVDPNAISTEPIFFTGHQGSVEDLQWSPTECTVFASCSTDGTVRLWDTRVARNAAALTHKASSTDVNVISWNAHVAHLLATGDDAGRFATWDLRALTQPLFASNWHNDAVTSLEWNPTDASVLAVSGADDQTTLWDFAVEEADEEPRIIGDREIPPQLLFVHQGQQFVKEIHWHPQLSGVLLSTAASGFNIFKTISV
jgi:ribosome assembly protein RRB1